ncbi:hypothetical protein HYS30_03950, partial [Candidatus Peregrinibacteria bacterium]|nr:hypothetical protein [Candidatus Peregrinibacteria bacterium]
NDLSTLLAEGRKFKVSLVSGHQYWDQLPTHLRGALLSAGSHVFFRLSSSDAAVLSSEVSVGAKQPYHRELTMLPLGHAVGRIGSNFPVTFAVPAFPKIRSSDDAVRNLRNQAVSWYSHPRSEIEAEIRARLEPPRQATPPFISDHDHEHDGQQGW